MAGSLKTEAIVLRSIRFGEADRVLHLYTPQRGRVSAIAKGVRRSKSRFGGRLEPFFRLLVAGVQVGMGSFGELPVGRTDIVRRGVSADTQHLVRIVAH